MKSDQEEYLSSASFNDWPASDDILIELGRLMSVWGSLESGLNIAIGKLAGFDDIHDIRPMILITHSTFPQRVDNISSLCHELKDQFPNLQTYPEVVSGLRSVQSARNKYAHNMIVIDPERGEHVIAKFSARGKISYSVEAVHPKDIRRVTAQIHVVALKLHTLVTGAIYPPIWKRVAPT